MSTIIHFAAHFGKVKVLRALIEEYKVDPQTKDNYGLHSGHYAARMGQLGALMYLRDQVDFSAPDAKFNKDTLGYAIRYGHFYCVLYLIRSQGVPVTQAHGESLH